MPSIFARLKRSPSASSRSADSSATSARDRRSSTASSLVPASDEDGTSISATVSSSPSSAGPGRFVEHLHGGAAVTPEGGKHKPVPLQLPVGVTPSQSAGTPKLVLTEEGSSTPKSFTDSPAGKGRVEVVGLRLGNQLAPVTQANTSNRDIQAPRESTYPSAGDRTRPVSDMTHERIPTASSGKSLKPATGHANRPRSASAVSTQDSHLSRSGSISSRFLDDPSSATLNPPDSRRSSTSKTGKKKRNKHRATSTSSGKSGATHTIAAALAKTGLHLASPTDPDLASSAHSTASKRLSVNQRSPFLVRRGDGDDDSLAVVDVGDDDVYDDEDDEDDDTDTDGEGRLPVTGFAVASNRRNQDFHALFPSVDEADYLIEDYGCAMAKEILVQGRLYVSENHICFHANIFGWVTNVVISFTDIKSIDKKMTALVIPNAICISTPKEKYTFASFISRDSTFDVMMNIWRLCNPNTVMSSVSVYHNGHSRPPSIDGDVPVAAGGGTGTVAGKGHAKTHCTCGKEGKHYSETALEATFPSTPEKIYSLMFNSEWLKSFMSDDQRLKDIEASDWKPIQQGSSKLSRSTTYIKPLNGSIGPKQTKCHIIDEHDHYDLHEFLSIVTTTRTPDVPSGSVFSVKTRTCLTWAGANSTKVIVTTTVEWTGKSWVKGIIEKSAIDGQKQYHDDLETGIRAYIKKHASEFGADDAVEIDEAAALQPGGAGSDAQLTEAEAYAAQQRKAREDRDRTYLQWSADLIISGLRSISAGIRVGTEAIDDILSNSPISKETILAIFIFALITSNLYTYFAYKPSKLARHARRLAKMDGGRQGYEQGDVAEAVRMLLGGGGQRGGDGMVLRERGGRSVSEEVEELKRVLDEVESRAKELRGVLRETAKEAGREIGQRTSLDGSLDDLD